MRKIKLFALIMLVVIAISSITAFADETQQAITFTDISADSLKHSIALVPSFAHKRENSPEVPCKLQFLSNADAFLESNGINLIPS